MGVRELQADDALGFSRWSLEIEEESRPYLVIGNKIGQMDSLWKYKN